MNASELKTRTLIWIIVAFGVDSLNHTAYAEDGNFLNFVIFNLPDRYMADIPKENRGRMLQILSRNSEEKRIDYRHNYLHWFSDGGNIGATSQLRIKLLPRPSTKFYDLQPLVFVHMPKPFADGSEPAADQTFILRYKKKDWIDVTETYFPRNLDRTLHFRPYRTIDVIGVAPWQKYERADGRGQAYKPGRFANVLTWQGDQFELRAEPPKWPEYNLAAPFDAGRLARLALDPDTNADRLVDLILHAGIERDARFRYLLERESLRKHEHVALALDAYRYALDRDVKALKRILEAVAAVEKPRGSWPLYVINHMDEWDKTIEAWHNHPGGDGAAAEEKGMFHHYRAFLYPKQYEKHRDKLLRRKDDQR